MGRRGAVLFLSALAMLFGLTGVAPVEAAGGGTPCAFDADVMLAPGFSDTRGAGSFSTSGQTGMIKCRGTVNGKQITGTGSFGTDGHYGANGGSTCGSGGSGDGTQYFTLPTSGGPERVDNTFVMTYGPYGRGGPISGEFHGDRFSGTYDMTPYDGDCATTPITKVHLTGSGTLT